MLSLRESNVKSKIQIFNDEAERSIQGQALKGDRMLGKSSPPRRDHGRGDRRGDDSGGAFPSLLCSPDIFSELKWRREMFENFFSSY